jgi:hypothetical protein
LSGTGASFALLAERMYIYDLVGGSADECRAISGGLTVCERTSKVWVIGRRLSYELNLRSGELQKVYETLAEERVDMCATVKYNSVKGEAKAVGGGGGGGGGKDATTGVKVAKAAPIDSKEISFDDDTTASTSGILIL